VGQAKTVFAHAPAARRCAIARPMRPRSGTRGALLQTQRACVCRATAEQEPRDCGVSAAGRRHRRGQDRGDCAARPAPTAPAQGRRRVVPRCGEVLHREGALLTPPPPRARARRAAASEPSGCVGGALASLRRVPRARAVSARGEAHRRKRAHCAHCVNMYRSFVTLAARAAARLTLNARGRGTLPGPDCGRSAGICMPSQRDATCSIPLHAPPPLVCHCEQRLSRLAIGLMVQKVTTTNPRP
jgi:hypothetical protein